MTRWSVGDITVMPGFPVEARECARCGELRPQQLVQRNRYGKGETWCVLPCVRCPLDLALKAS